MVTREAFTCKWFPWMQDIMNFVTKLVDDICKHYCNFTSDLKRSEDQLLCCETLLMKNLTAVLM